MTELESKLKAIIPKPNSQFKKLQGGDPCYFSSWSTDRQGTSCLYYWFWDKGKTSKNKKRIPIKEIIAAARECSETGVFDRDTFRRHCPLAASDGECAFTMVGRCLELLGIAEYAGHGKGFRKIC